MATQTTIPAKPPRHRIDAAGIHSARRLHASILVLALLVPILGATMSHEPPGRVSLPGLASHPLPTFCVTRQFGFECATCGVTRSIIALMHGNWTASLQFHRFGWLLALLIVSQIPYRAYRLLHPARPLPVIKACGLALLAVTLLLVLGNWILGLLGIAY